MAEPSSPNFPATAAEAVANRDLTGKVFVVTGAYSGLGAATSKALASAGATLVLAGRSQRSQAEFSAKLQSELAGEGDSDVAFRIDASRAVDLGDLASVAAFARYVRSRYETIDCLINNAGVMNTPPGQTTDGFEIQMGTNVIGHHLLARSLVDQTLRQVWLSSTGHSLIGDPPGNHDLENAPRIDIDAIRTMDPKNYDSWRRYQQSKLGPILLAKQFAREHARLVTCAVHPGVVKTKLARHMSAWLMVRYLIAGLRGQSQRLVSPEQGARTQTLCATMPASELQNGAYYADCAVATPAVAAQNEADAKRLYDFCEAVTSEFHF